MIRVLYASRTAAAFVLALAAGASFQAQANGVICPAGCEVPPLAEIWAEGQEGIAFCAEQALDSFDNSSPGMSMMARAEVACLRDFAIEAYLKYNDVDCLSGEEFAQHLDRLLESYVAITSAVQLGHVAKLGCSGGTGQPLGESYIMASLLRDVIRKIYVDAVDSNTGDMCLCPWQDDPRVD